MITTDLAIVPEIFSQEETKKITSVLEKFEESAWIPGKIGRNGIGVVDEKIRRNHDLDENYYPPFLLKIGDRLDKILSDIYLSHPFYSHLVFERGFFTISKNSLGDYFRWHADMDSENTRLACLLIHLSDNKSHNLSGGETSFDLGNDARLIVTPRRGQGIYFNPSLMHKGHTVTKGTKYTIIHSIKLPSSSN